MSKKTPVASYAITRNSQSNEIHMIILLTCERRRLSYATVRNEPSNSRLIGFGVV
jgi:hypothetical protein